MLPQLMKLKNLVILICTLVILSSNLKAQTYLIAIDHQLSLQDAFFRESTVWFANAEALPDCPVVLLVRALHTGSVCQTGVRTGVCLAYPQYYLYRS